jgi:SAM-dependent methyltransferase
MNPLYRLHGGYVHRRRVRILARHFAALIPPEASLLDVGCGDGHLAQQIIAQCPTITVTGIDTFVRPDAVIAVQAFDGLHLPFAAATFDFVLFADVLHHATNPLALLRDAIRIARHGILIKDHLASGLMDRVVLSFMDWVGNARHGVKLTYNYTSPEQWKSYFDELRLNPTAWQTHLGLYPMPASLIFDRNLHFVARLEQN